jgi:hypothetical protein
MTGWTSDGLAHTDRTEGARHRLAATRGQFLERDDLQLERKTPPAALRIRYGWVLR